MEVGDEALFSCTLSHLPKLRTIGPCGPPRPESGPRHGKEGTWLSQTHTYRQCVICGAHYIHALYLSVRRLRMATVLITEARL